MSFTNTEPQSHQGENTWFTPKQYIDALGPFDTAKVHIERDLGGCGLATPWEGDVWLNPPYGKEIGPFIDKFIEHKKGVMLIFARMGSEPVQKLVRSGAMMFCLRRRVYFIQKDGLKSTNAGTDSMLVFFDDKYIERCLVMDGVFVKSPYVH